MITDRREIDAIIRASQVCRLAMSKDNMPYLIPLSFGYDGEAIYVHTGRLGKKIDYFESNNRVCFEFENNVRLLPNEERPCDSSFGYESVIGFGSIAEVTMPEQKEEALGQIVGRYLEKPGEIPRPMLAAVRVWRISIDSVTAKRKPRQPVEGNRADASS